VEFLLGLGIGGLALWLYRMRLLKTLKEATQQHWLQSSGLQSSGLQSSGLQSSGLQSSGLQSLPSGFPQSDLRSSTEGSESPALSVTAQLLRSLDFLQERNQFLEEQLADWLSIVGMAPVGYLQVDEDNQLIWSNEPALNLLDIRHYDMNEPRLLLEVVRSYDLDSLIEQARSTGKPCQREWNHYPVSIEVAHVTTPTAHPLRGYAMPLQDGTQVGVFLESRAEAQTLSQQRDRWTSDVAHELKTPLTSIRLVAETLQSRLNPPLRTWVDRLLKETLRLSTLVQEILDLSHLETAVTRPLKLNLINLPDLIQSTWITLEPIAIAKQIPFIYQGPEQLHLQAEEARIHRVLLNLLDNSIKYTLPERPILLQLSLVQDSSLITAQYSTATIVQIDLIDGGAGFPEDDIPFVFERFYRADPSRARTLEPYVAQQPNENNFADTTKTLTQDIPPQTFQPSSGSGLGLAIVRQIVELHKGTVTARNHPEGGAWIQIRLPQSQ
jgi:two-component system, OmpR family, phosphate regulon sensor histidine kinase PhoR